MAKYPGKIKKKSKGSGSGPRSQRKRNYVGLVVGTSITSRDYTIIYLVLILFLK
jgi:hypothetical protein